MAHSSILTEMLPEAGMNVLNGPRRRWGQNRAGSHERSASAALSDADGVILVMERPTLTAELERFCPYQQSIDHLRRYCAFSRLAKGMRSLPLRPTLSASLCER